MSLEEALATFKARGFDLLLAEASVQQAEGERRSASALPSPVLSLSVGRSVGYDASAAGPGASSRSFGAAISDSNALSDLLWGKRRLRTRAAEAALDAARLGRKDAERLLLTQVKQQYLQLALAQQGLALAEDLVAGAQRTLELVQVRFRAGAVSEADVVRARVAALESDQGREGARQVLASAQAGLAFLLGYRCASPELRAARSFDPPSGSTQPLDRAVLLAQAQRQRADLQVAQAEVKRAEASSALAHRAWAPDLTWSFGVTQEGTGQFALQPRTYTLGLAVPLPSVRRTRGDIAKAEADRRMQLVQADKLEAQVVLEVAQAAAAFEASRAQAARMEAELLPAAKRALDLVTFQYEKGAAPLLDLLEARRTYLGVQAERMQGLQAYWSAAFALDQALGVETSR